MCHVSRGVQRMNQNKLGGELVRNARERVLFIGGENDHCIISAVLDSVELNAVFELDLRDFQLCLACCMAAFCEEKTSRRLMN